MSHQRRTHGRLVTRKLSFNLVTRPAGLKWTSRAGEAACDDHAKAMPLHLRPSFVGSLRRRILLERSVTESVVYPEVANPRIDDGCGLECFSVAKLFVYDSL